MLVCAFCGRAYEVDHLSKEELEALKCVSDDCPSHEEGSPECLSYEVEEF